MDCPECHRLEIERESRQLAYTVAVSRMKLAALNTSNHPEYMNRIAAAQEALIDLTQIEAEFTQHQNRHAVPE